MARIDTAAPDPAAWRADSLGPAREVELRQGRLRYHDVGAGPPLVFAHGVLANANLWREVVRRLAPDFRCVALDLPLGAHAVAMPHADLSPPGIADLIADAIEGIRLEAVTLVANDTAGALAQIVATRRPERLGRLVLTSCEVFENFQPPMIRNMLMPARVPTLVPLAFAGLRLRPLRRLPIAYGWLAKRPIAPAAQDSYVLIAWSREDRFFPVEHAERLARILPDARLEWIEDAYSFSPEDRPERVAELVAGFVRGD